MSGSGPKALGVSTGQPGRIDQFGEAHLRELQPGLQVHIPQQTVDPTRKRDQRLDHLTDEGGETGWTNQERLVSEQSLLRHRREQAWQRFNERRGGGTNSGAVQIDGGPIKLGDLFPTLPTIQQPMTGWQRLDHWHQEAAKFEEAHRDRTDLGTDGSPDLTVEVATPRPRTGANKRRRFTLAR